MAMRRIDSIDRQLEQQNRAERQQIEKEHLQEKTYKRRQVKWGWVSNSLAIIAILISLWPHIFTSREEYHTRIEMNALQMKIDELQRQLDDIEFQRRVEDSLKMMENLKEPQL